MTRGLGLGGGVLLLFKSEIIQTTIQIELAIKRVCTRLVAMGSLHAYITVDVPGTFHFWCFRALVSLGLVYASGLNIRIKKGLAR